MYKFFRDRNVLQVIVCFGILNIASFILLTPIRIIRVTVLFSYQRKAGDDGRISFITNNKIVMNENVISLSLRINK